MTFLKDLFDLGGKTAIVAGGAGVIGTVMSEALLKAGANVVIWSRTQASIDKALERLEASTNAAARIQGIRVDSGNETEVANALQASVDACGPPEILINAVGGNIGKAAFVESDLAQFEEVLKLIDVPEAARGISGAPQLEVYPVTTADPQSVLQVLQTLLAGDTSVKLATDPALSDILAEGVVTTTAYSYDGTLAYSTTYYWAVRAVEPGVSEWSAVGSFTTEAAPPEPAPPPRGGLLHKVPANLRTALRPR